MISADLRTKLVAVATSAGGRVYALTVPRSVSYPAVTFQRVSDPRSSDHGGSTGLVEARYQITAWAPSYDEAEQVAEEIVAGLHGFRGTMGSTTVARISCEGGSDDYEQGVGPSGSAGLCGVAKDYVIQYTE